jgi:hypothetical protein
MNRHANQAIVPRAFAILNLIGFNHPNDPDIHQAANVRRLIHEHHDIQRVAVFGQRARDKTEIKGKPVLSAADRLRRTRRISGHSQTCCGGPLGFQ